jgi:hypothetical protein
MRLRAGFDGRLRGFSVVSAEAPSANGNPSALLEADWLNDEISFK